MNSFILLAQNSDIYYENHRTNVMDEKQLSECVNRQRLERDLLHLSIKIQCKLFGNPRRHRLPTILSANSPQSAERVQKKRLRPPWRTRWGRLGARPTAAEAELCLEDSLRRASPQEASGSWVDAKVLQSLPSLLDGATLSTSLARAGGAPQRELESRSRLV